MATLHDLDRAALVAILKEPKNSLVKQYQTILEFENVGLRFTDDAVDEIADEAMKRNVGARGLKVILEELMLDVMYRDPLRGGDRGVRHHEGRRPAARCADPVAQEGRLTAFSPASPGPAPSARGQSARTKR